MFKFQELSHEDFISEASKVFYRSMAEVVDAFIKQGFTLTPVYFRIERGRKVANEPCEIKDADGFLVAIGGMYKFILEGNPNALAGETITPKISLFK